jgi:hypothetical protein
MENEKTYEQWEMEQIEKLANFPAGELLLFAVNAAAELTQYCLLVRANASGQPEEQMVADHNLTEELKEKIAQCTVLLDALQIRFGDVAEQEVAFLEEIEAMLEE